MKISHGRWCEATTRVWRGTQQRGTEDCIRLSSAREWRSLMPSVCESPALLNGPESSGIKSSSKETPDRRFLGFQVVAQIHAESRFLVCCSTGSLLLGLVWSYFPGIPKTFFRVSFELDLIPGDSGPFRRAWLSQPSAIYSGLSAAMPSNPGVYSIFSARSPPTSWNLQCLHCKTALIVPQKLSITRNRGNDGLQNTILTKKALAQQLALKIIPAKLKVALA